MKEQRWCGDCGAGRLNNQFDFELTDSDGVVRDFCGASCLAAWAEMRRADAERLFRRELELRRIVEAEQAAS
jgi:hypothetical protein